MSVDTGYDADTKTSVQSYIEVACARQGSILVLLARTAPAGSPALTASVSARISATVRLFRLWPSDLDIVGSHDGCF